MREILFCGKREDDGKMIRGSETYIRDGDGVWLADYTKEGCDVVKVIPETVGICFGIPDKNGSNIFEGDVCLLGFEWPNGTADSWIAVVKFGKPNCTYSYGWHLEWKGGARGLNPSILLWIGNEDNGATCEVIGNIYDDPELLKDLKVEETK